MAKVVFCAVFFLLLIGGGFMDEMYECNDEQNTCCEDPNAELVDCVNRCPGGTCLQPEFIPCDAPCAKGCQCKKGYVKDAQEKCILLSKCLRCGANEELVECNNPCPPEDCSSIGKMFRCAAVDPNTCKSACKCKLNFKRNSKGVCVHVSKCPPLKCTGKNEVYDACPKSCTPKTCLDLESTDVCVEDDPLVCRPRCRCRDGYVRDDNNGRICVPKAKCAKKNICPKNEEYSDNVDPCNTCRQKLFTDTKCFPGEKIPGCSCKAGYYRNNERQCVNIDQCKETICANEENMEYSHCTNRECHSTCEQPDREKTCCPTKPCAPGCVCKKGFLTTEYPSGCSKREEDCRCKDPNAMSVACLQRCPGETCEEAEVPCPLILESECKRGCQCKPGFVKNKNDKCTSLTKCVPRKDSAVCKDPFEEISDTTAGACDATFPMKIDGCQCRKGFLWASQSNRTCIRQDDCGPRKCKDKNKVWSLCGNNGCQPACHIGPNSSGCPGFICIPGCICKPGLLWEKETDKCVKVNECKNNLRECKGENQEYSACVNRCSRCDVVMNKKTCTSDFCFEGCDCKPGYHRNSLDKCVKLCNCDCGANEEYSENSPSCPETCSNRGLPRCSKTRPGCVCKSGYIRDENEDCILFSECPTQING